MVRYGSLANNETSNKPIAATISRWLVSSSKLATRKRQATELECDTANIQNHAVTEVENFHGFKPHFWVLISVRHDVPADHPQAEGSRRSLYFHLM